MDLQIAISSDKNYTKHFNQVNVNINFVTWNEASLTQNVHLIIAADIQTCIALKNLAVILGPGCFILLEETAAQLDLESALKEANLILVGKQINSSGKSYLLLKKQRKRREAITIQITGKDLSWLENAKNVLKNFDNKGQEIILVSQDKDPIGKIIK